MIKKTVIYLYFSKKEKLTDRAGFTSTKSGHMTSFYPIRMIFFSVYSLILQREPGNN